MSKWHEKVGGGRNKMKKKKIEDKLRSYGIRKITVIYHTMERSWLLEDIWVVTAKMAYL
jgi:hypothetical protein